ncbi:MAG: hypothetical protein UT91_C0028G0009 [Parcubacteria group bacterium GW2011_GWA2_40_23]|nr:MAG: hypothetical protein UT91_C0028G0009 [Parcubacteria group bacterium GW2011_GWA2_40_23]
MPGTSQVPVSLRHEESVRELNALELETVRSPHTLLVPVVVDRDSLVESQGQTVVERGAMLQLDDLAILQVYHSWELRGPGELRDQVHHGCVKNVLQRIRTIV